MWTKSKKSRMRLAKRRCRKAAWVITALAIGVGAGACDSLLEVELRGEVDSSDLLDPALAEILALSAQADFECAISDEIRNPGLWFDVFVHTGVSDAMAVIENRSPEIGLFADPCNSGGGLSAPRYVPLQTARLSSKTAREIIGGHDEADVSDKDFLLARANLYGGYAIQMLGEQYCEVPFDGGPGMSREDTWRFAEERFSDVIQHSNSVTASNTAVAADLRAAAYVGRARARLNLGIGGVVSDASLVPEGFEFVATHDENPTRRRNKVYNYNGANEQEMPHRSFSDLTISADGRLTVNDGMPDPRVVVETIPGQFGTRGDVILRLQRKYNSWSDPIPFASWREAQLMIAEIEGGQAAVDIINLLRTNTAGLPENIDASAWPLPQFASNDAAEIVATLREERRRELWMHGSRPGDMLRWGTEFERVGEVGNQRGPGGCMPLPNIERDGNANL